MRDDLVNHGLELGNSNDALSLFLVHLGDDDAGELCVEAEAHHFAAVLRDLLPDQRLHVVEDGGGYRDGLKDAVDNSFLAGRQSGLLPNLDHLERDQRLQLLHLHRPSDLVHGLAKLQDLVPPLRLLVRPVVIPPPDDVDNLLEDIRLDDFAIGSAVGPQQNIQLLKRALGSVDLDLDVLLQQLLCIWPGLQFLRVFANFMYNLYSSITRYSSTSKMR